MPKGRNVKPLVVVGAGGFGREVAWLVRDLNATNPTWDLIGFIDDHVHGKTVEGYAILGDRSYLYRMSPKPFVSCAIGDPRLRSQMVADIETQGMEFATLIHPSVIMSRHVRVGAGSIICAGCILTTNIDIGKHGILNLGCRVGHDTVLGDFASLMPGTNLAGEVVVGEGCYFGLNACVINKVTVGNWSVIGAGAAVVRDIPPGVVAVGVPAKPVRSIER